MNKLILLFLLFLLQTMPVFSSDFRGIPFGEDCIYLNLYEHNAGSRQTKKDHQYLVEDFVYLGVSFKGISHITYKCNSDNFFFWCRSFATSKKTWMEAKPSTRCFIPNYNAR